MSEREPKLLVLDMAEALDRALSYVDGMDFEARCVRNFDFFTEIRSLSLSKGPLWG
jgi:hypothetical protein